MLRQYLVRRLTLLFFMVLLLSLFTFTLSYLFPGDVSTNLSGIDSAGFNANDQITEKYKLNESYLSQYFAFIQHIVNGDWGLSLASGQPVFEHVKTLFPATVELALYALLISILIGIPTGVIAAAYHKKWQDHVIYTVTLFAYSTPVFWLALILIMAFCLQLGLLPMSGRISLLFEVEHQTGFLLIDILLSNNTYKQAALIDAFHHLLLPSIVLATYPTAVLVRFTKDAMLDVLDKSYIKSARAKGLNHSQIIFHHALRNALLPVISQIGLQFSTLITLAMITEVIFSWPGIGAWLINSIYQRDFPAIMGGLLTVSLFVIIATMIADILNTILDPVSRNRSHGQV